MLSFLPAPLLGVLSTTLIVSNTVMCCIPLFLFSFVKLIIPLRGWQTFWTKILIIIAETWITNNNLALALVHRIKWDIEGLENLNKDGWYLVSCNHQSWVDITVLQRIFNYKIPFLKFFLKKELIWVPLLGIAWWALDFPFMKRYTKAEIEKNPNLKGKDLETTKKACEKFKYTPVSVMNFLEGTRFSKSKHEKQQSPYQHLLRPKAGGVAFVLSAMGGQIKSMVDVTIVYHDKNFEIWDLMCGRISKITVRITQREIPAAMLNGNYEDDPKFREGFQEWVSSIWEEKDQLITELKK